MTELDVLCVGAANHDAIAVVDHYPGQDERVIADFFVAAPGGPAATAAVALARLGIKVGLCATVGADATGTAVIEALDAEGVDIGQVRRAAQTGRSSIVVSRATATRAIVTSPPTAPPTPDLTVARWIHVDHAGYGPAVQKLSELEHAGRPDADRPALSIDAGNPIADLDLRHATLYAPTLAALQRRYPQTSPTQALTAARDEGAQIVVATDGANGATVLHDGDARHVPGFAVAPVSTVGAGDVFHGALLAGIVDELPLPAAVRRANACAAMSCAGVDGQSAIPDATSLDQFLESHQPSGPTTTGHRRGGPS